MVQVGNFNYIPSKSTLILYKATLLTIEQMRKILGIYQESSSPTLSQTHEQSPVSSKTQKAEAPISDNDLLSNPFFQTLKPLN